MIKEKLNKVSVFSKLSKRHYISFLLVFLLIGITTNHVYAATPKLVTGTVELAKAVTTWLLLIIPVGAGAILGIFAIQKMLADDPGVIAEKNKMMKNVLVGAAVAETASGLVTVILSFYS